MTVDREALVAKARADRRGYRRVRVDFKGRLFVPGEERESVCSIVDMSPSGAQVVCEAVPPPNTPVVVYIDGFGRFEATVVRPIKGEEAESAFGVKFNCSAMKRDRVAEQLAQYVDHGVVDETALRRHDRTPTKGLARFTRASGEIVNCEVLDLSLSGVSLATNLRPPIGEFVLIGQMAGQVVRHHETGIGITFVAGMPEKAENGRSLPKLNLNR
ncbi:MAG TPA: PilZ domain-containing protein [Rhizomicrobium sp.]|nr:PilZ domain-containing protein [Rhizomicrobium sp.]